MGIPVIDLAGALAPGGPRVAEVVQQMRAAATSAGFFYVKNHGVSPEMVARQFDTTRELMNLPKARREALSIDKSPIMRGFEGLGAQTLDENAQPDLKESFYCGMEWPADHPYAKAGYQTYGPNQWPEELPDVRSQCTTYVDEMNKLSVRLMQLLALSLSLPEDYFNTACKDPMVTLRMVKYPPHPKDADDRTFGAGAHTDWGAVTILAQDSSGGLEVQMPDGSWVAATPIEGTFVVNLGDMIPRWTNGLYHSNPHRVRNMYTGAPRYSIPFFFEPEFFARIEPVPGTVPDGEAPKYKACTAGEHLNEMYAKTYGFKSQSAETAPA